MVEELQQWAASIFAETQSDRGMVLAVLVTLQRQLKHWTISWECSNLVVSNLVVKSYSLKVCFSSGVCFGLLWFKACSNPAAPGTVNMCLDFQRNYI